MFGLKEESDEDISTVIGEVLVSVGQKPCHESVRTGLKRDSAGDKPRSVKVSFASSATEVLRSAKQLENVEKFKNVIICPDRTSEENKSRREAVALLKKKFFEGPGKRYFIRNNQVVTE